MKHLRSFYFLFLVGAFPLAFLNAGSPQAFPCESGSWQVLVGAVDSVDIEHKNIEIRIRGGAQTIPQRWAHEDWTKSDWSKTGRFSARDFALQVRPNANQKVKFPFTAETTVFRATSQGLETLKATQVESGTPVLVVLAAGQCWPSSEKETASWAPEARIAKLALLQACIEETCVKAKCKGKTDCKEKVCNCEHAP